MTIKILRLSPKPLKKLISSNIFSFEKLKESWGLFCVFYHICTW